MNKCDNACKEFSKVPGTEQVLKKQEPIVLRSVIALLVYPNVLDHDSVIKA